MLIQANFISKEAMPKMEKTMADLKMTEDAKQFIEQLLKLQVPERIKEQDACEGWNIDYHAPCCREVGCRECKKRKGTPKL